MVKTAERRPHWIRAHSVLLIGHFVDSGSGKVKMFFLIFAHNQVMMAFTAVCSRVIMVKGRFYVAFQKKILFFLV